MDITSAASTANVQTSQASETAVQLHKKSLEIQEQAAKELIESVPDPESSMGHHVDEMV